jgi:ribosomal-protein-alanine N-acetyltransferase
MRDFAVIPTLETARLFLRPLERADAQQIQALFPHWEIVRYLRSVVPWPYPTDGAERFLDHALAANARGEEWHWTLRLKTDPGALIGAISLMTKKEDNRGFWMGLPWQGRGWMTEAADAVTDFWFYTLKFPVLRTSKAAENAASRRISEKQGMRLVATQEANYVAGRLPREIWEITAEQWKARRSAK